MPLIERNGSLISFSRLLPPLNAGMQSCRHSSRLSFRGVPQDGSHHKVAVQVSLHTSFLLALSPVFLSNNGPCPRRHWSRVGFCSAIEFLIQGLCVAFAFCMEASTSIESNRPGRPICSACCTTQHNPVSLSCFLHLFMSEYPRRHSGITTRPPHTPAAWSLSSPAPPRRLPFK